MSSGTTAATLACTDADSATNNNNVMTYTITSVSGTPGAGAFAVSTSGVVTVASALDYETQTLHDIEVSFKTLYSDFIKYFPFEVEYF